MTKFNLILNAVIVIFISSCSNPRESTRVKNVVVGIQKSPSNSLMIIASEKQFFDTSEVKVILKDFAAGKFALQALLGNANDVDIAVCAETPVVLSSMAGNKIKVISQIVDARNECRIVVRKEDDLKTPQQYFSKKRKLATSQGGSPEWTSFNFIKSNNLDVTKIEIIAMQPQDQPVALAKAAVDGICIFDPFARIAEKQLSNNGLTFLNSNLTSYYVLCIKGEKSDNRQLKAVLKGLVKAHEFIIKNPDESKNVIAKYTGLDKDLIDDTWGNYNFNVGLSHELVNLCLDEANWAILSGKYPKGSDIPDFSRVVDTTILKQL